MTTTELISLARTQFLDDSITPYKWSDTYLAQLLTLAQREACRRASLILDKTTQTSANVASGTATDTIANKLVDSGAAFTTTMVGKTVYNSTDNTWAVITAMDSATQLNLSTDIMVSGESYTIGDASKALARVCVSSGVAEYTLSDKVIKIDKCYLASRGRAYPLIQKLQLNSTSKGTPVWYMEDRKLITLYPEPDASMNSGTGIDTLNLEVYRLPLADLTISPNTTPEIDEEYHFDLIHYMCFLAYKKQDSETYDPNMSKWHEQQFAMKFGLPISAESETKLKKLPSNFELNPRAFGL